MADLRDEFIRSYKRGNVEMWKAAAIIAVKVHVGGRGRRWEAADANDKMSADGFAAWINGEGPSIINGETVRRYWHAWQRAAAKGIVPDSGALDPDTEWGTADDLIDIDHDDEVVSIEEVARDHRFLDYYEKSKSAAKEDETAPPLPAPPPPDELDAERPKGMHEDLDWRLSAIEHGVTSTLTWDRWEQFGATVTDHMREKYVARIRKAVSDLEAIATQMDPPEEPS